MGNGYSQTSEISALKDIVDSCDTKHEEKKPENVPLLDSPHEKLQPCPEINNSETVDNPTSLPVIPANTEHVADSPSEKIQLPQLINTSESSDKKFDPLFVVSTDHVLGYSTNLEQMKVWIDEDIRKTKNNFFPGFEVERNEMSNDNLVYSVTVYESAINTLMARRNIGIQYNVWKIFPLSEKTGI